MVLIKIFIDIGHGGNDPGAVFHNLKEKDINLVVGLALKDTLIKCGFQVMVCRENDTYLSLEKRCKLANKWGSDLFISVHHNAGGGDGYEVIHSIFYDEGEEVAKIIANHFENIGQNPHGKNGVYSKANSSGNADYYYVIRNTDMPSIITEFGYVDNLIDRELFDEKDELIKEGKAIAKAICEYYKVKYKEDDIMLQEWQKKMGEEALDNLNKKGLVVNSEQWKKTLEENVPQWLFFSMLDRLSDK